MKQVTETPRILVVDDDMDLLMLLERRLLKEGFEVESAASLREAEEYIQLFKPHLLVLDVNVAGEDGRKLSAKLKIEGASTKIVVISGYDYSAARAALFGADELVPKPINTDYLIFVINKHLYGE